MGDDEIFYFSVAGKSNTGKTSLVEEIIKRLKDKDHTVATLKHTKGDHSIDQEGKDTWRHRKAGSDLIIFSTPSETSFIYKEKLELDKLLRTVNADKKYDVLVIEGMKKGDIPKIGMGDPDIDSDIDYDGNLEEIIDWVEENIEITRIWNSLPKLDCGDCGYEGCRDFARSVYEGENTIENCKRLNLGLIDLMVNDKKVPLGRFPSSIIRGSIIGMLKNLKGIDDVNKIEISIDNIDKNMDE